MIAHSSFLILHFSFLIYNWDYLVWSAGADLGLSLLIATADAIEDEGIDELEDGID